MDRSLKGHPYVKSALDMACWDILGKVCNAPVCELLGGRFGDNFKLYRAISQGTAYEMAENVMKYLNEGYRIFQLKVGGNPKDDIDRIRTVRSILDEKVRFLFFFLMY
jgi:L-alanine-DL-glutamate epimerase-like enolase superfamily enzyme